jgi:hypothetical protein
VERLPVSDLLPEAVDVGFGLAATREVNDVGGHV